MGSVGYAAPIYGYGHGIAHHGGHATSFVARSPQGLHGHFGYGKREAEAEPEADAYYGYGYGRVRTRIRTPSGIPRSGIQAWRILRPWIRSWIRIRLPRIGFSLSRCLCNVFPLLKIKILKCHIRRYILSPSNKILV